MVISHKYKFIFVKTAKTAGTSIEVFLDRYCGGKDILTPFAFPEENHKPRNYKGIFNPFPDIKDNYSSKKSFTLTESGSILKDFFTFQKFYHHIPAYMIKNRISEEVWNSYYKFTVERNPWEKVISGWFYYCNSYKKDLNLEQYLRFCKDRIERRNRGTGVCPYNYPNYSDPTTGKILVDRCVRYENLQNEFKEVLDKLGIISSEGLNIYAKKGRKRRNYQEYYSKKQRVFVEELFEKEISLHGYSYN